MSRTQMRREERFAETKANGGLAPVKTHNYSTYHHWGCRCQPCVDSHSQRMVADRQRRCARTRANGGVAPTQKHGVSTYSNWNCRCWICVRAWSIKNRNKRLPREERVPLPAAVSVLPVVAGAGFEPATTGV